MSTRFSRSSMKTKATPGKSRSGTYWQTGLARSAGLVDTILFFRCALTDSSGMPTLNCPNPAVLNDGASSFPAWHTGVVSIDSNAVKHKSFDVMISRAPHYQRPPGLVNDGLYSSAHGCSWLADPRTASTGHPPTCAVTGPSF
jgi:hypothetical protein